MKQFICILLAFLCALAMVGCSNTEQLAQNSSPTKTEASSVTASSPDVTTISGVYSFQADMKIPLTDLGDFTTVDLNGNTVGKEIFQDYKVTMVNLWATWCPYCIQEIPTLERLANTYEGKAGVLGILVDGTNTETLEPDSMMMEEGAYLMEEGGGTYPTIVPDAELATGIVAYAPALPATILVDENGNIIGGGMFLGVYSEQEWSAMLDEILAEDNQ